MRNYALLFSFLFLFVVTDLDAQRRSGRASKRVDESKNVENVKPDELHKKYGFSSRDQMVEFLLEKDLKRSDKRIVEKYGKGKKLSKSKARNFESLLKQHAGERAVSESGRSGRVSGDRALSSRESSSSRAKSRGRSGRQESQNEGPSFDEIDTNNDGEISRDEARVFFGDEDDFDAKYDEVDADNSGSVDPQEYADANEGDQDGDHDWYCQICDMHFANEH